MDDALDLYDYLPVYFKNPSEEEYISFLWETFRFNYENGKYQFAFLAYHMLMMSFVYFNIWQIKQTRPEDFAKGLIGFARDESALLRATSPFSFSIVNERTVLRFLKLIACDNSQIGAYARLVDDRNNSAHSNGNIFFRTQDAVDVQISQVLRSVEEIQDHSQPIIALCYEEFLLHSRDLQEWEYPNAEEQIREVLIRSNYMSRKDIELCLSFDISALGDDNKETIEALHRSLSETYGTENQDMQ